MNNVNFKLDASDNLTLKVMASNHETVDANLIAWIDFDQNGQYDPNEAAIPMTIAPGANNQIYHLNWSDISFKIQNGLSYLRIRASTEDFKSTDPVKALADGKVEDYMLNLNAYNINKLAEVKSKGGNKADFGDTIIYTLIVENNLTQVVAVDVLDPLSEFIQYIPNSANEFGQISNDDKQVEWNGIKLPPGKTTLSFEAKIIKRPSNNIIGNIAYVARNNDTINSGHNCNLAEIEINKIIALNDCALNWINTTSRIEVLKNDLHDSKSLPAINIPPTIGTATVLPDSSIQYIPNLNISGLDSLSYSIADELGNTRSAWVYIAVLKPLSDQLLICQNSTANIGVEQTNEVQVLWHKEITDENPFASGNNLTVDMKENDTVFYLGVSIKGLCQPDHKIALPIALGKAPVYTDVRVQACALPERLINLSKFIDTTFIPNANWALNWTSAPSSPEVNAQHRVNTADFVPNAVYKYIYQSVSNCGTSVANLYLSTGRENTVPTQTEIIMCQHLSENIHLKQILGLTAGGTWSFSNELDPYVKKIQAEPHKGAIIFNGTQAYADGIGTTITHLTDNQAKEVEFIYVTPPNSCVGSVSYKIKIILTSAYL